MLGVVSGLKPSPSSCLIQRRTHRIGDLIRIHDHLSVDVAGSTADDLDQAGARPEEALLVSVKDCDQRHLGQVQAFTEQVDTHQDVVISQPQLAEKLHPLERIDLRVQVASPHPHLEQVVGQVLRHFLGERGHQHPLVGYCSLPYLVEQVVNLPLGGTHDHLWVHQTGRPDDLFDYLIRSLEFKWAWCRRHENDLTGLIQPLIKPQWPVVTCRRKPKSVFDQLVLATAISLVLSVKLWDGNVALVDDRDEILGKIVQ